MMYQRVFKQDVTLHDMEWYVNFHVTYLTFVKLCDVLRPYTKHRDTNYKPSLSIEKVVSLVLKKLALG